MPAYIYAQDLEDTIEDELGRGSEDEEIISDTLEDELEDEPAPKSTAKQAPAPTPEPKAAEPVVEEEDEDIAEMEDGIESEEPDQATEKPAAKTEPPVKEEPIDLEVEEELAEQATPSQPKSEKKARNIYEETLASFDDQANPQFEARIYDIFSKRKQVADEQWSTLVGRNSSGIYKVQKGDTLWDISNTFFGDGNFWPKLWSENSILTNPHEINVGKAIAFIAGTEESAPAVSVSDVKNSKSGGVLDVGAEASSPVYPEDREAQLTEDDIAAGTVLEEQAIVGGRPEIPEPMTPSRPSLKNLPPSFIEPVPPKVTKQFDDTGLDVGRRKAFEANGQLYVPSYLSDGKPDSIGRVSEMISKEKTAGYLQDLIITINRSASPGEKFSAIMPRGNVSNPKAKTYGPTVDIGGLVEIREVINQSRNMYRASVVNSVGAIELGALITEVPLPRAEFSMRGPRVDLEAVVIGGQYSNQRRLLGTGAVIYLDKGSRQGLSEGQILAVRGDRTLRRDTEVPEYMRPIATVKLVRVFERVSTALVINANEEIRPGDLTGGPLPRPAETIGNLRATARPVEIKEREEETEYKEEMSGELSEEELEE